MKKFASLPLLLVLMSLPIGCSRSLSSSVSPAFNSSIRFEGPPVIVEGRFEFRLAYGEPAGVYSRQWAYLEGLQPDTSGMASDRVLDLGSILSGGTHHAVAERPNGQQGAFPFSFELSDWEVPAGVTALRIRAVEASLEGTYADSRVQNLSVAFSDWTPYPATP